MIGQRQRVRYIHIARTIEEMRNYSRNWTQRSVPLTRGFVPTMGALHEGHVSLMKRGRQENDIMISSIFVNPTQFGVGEDLDKYPRTFEKDVEMMKSAGVDCVFAPSDVNIMYPKGGSLVHVEPLQFGDILEGKARPNFFRGVATVVTKLFNIVQPSVAYFGQKDVSQCILVQRMVKDLNIPIDIQVCETIREHDGLAMSSRNVYLSKTERAVASVLFKALSAAKHLCEADAHKIIHRKELIEAAEKVFASEPLVSKIEYVSIASHRDMTELESVQAANGGAVISSAIRLGSVRLIDNLLIGSSKQLLEKTHHC